MNKKQIDKLLDEQKFTIGNADASFSLIGLVFNYYANSEKFHGVNINFIGAYFNPKHRPKFYQIISQKDLDSIGKKIYGDYLKDPKTLDRKINKHKEYTNQVRNLWLKYNSSLNKGVALNNFFDSLYPWWSYAMFGEERGENIETKIIPAFAVRHNMSVSQARKIVSVMSHPNEQSVLNVERIDFLNICLSIVSNSKFKNALSNGEYNKLSKERDVKKNLEKYLKNNFWSKTTFSNTTEITIKAILRDVNDFLKNKSKVEINKELNLISKNLKKIHNEQEKIINKIRLSALDKKDFNYAKKIVRWVDLRKKWMMEICYYTFLIIKDIADRHNLKYEEISFYTYLEIKDLVLKGKKISYKKIKSRSGNMFVIYEKGYKAKYYYGQIAKKMFEMVRSDDNKEVKGVVASTGKNRIYRGIVRIVRDVKEDRFNKGEILVTSMTRIEYVPFMRKALAIITNEGGLACHAAIISRELELPCIIGTKNATQILKNGDKVELDMESGIVKILR